MKTAWITVNQNNCKVGDEIRRTGEKGIITWKGYGRAIVTLTSGKSKGHWVHFSFRSPGALGDYSDPDLVTDWKIKEKDLEKAENSNRKTAKRKIQ